MGTRIVQVANFYARHSGGLRTTVDALGRAYVDAGFERVLVVPGPADADEDTKSGRRITLRSPSLPGSGGYRVLPGTGPVRAVLAELPPDHLEVSDKLTLCGLGPWGASNGVRAVLVSHERLDAILAPRVPRAVPLAAFADRWNRRLARGFAAVVCPSAFAAAEFTRVGATNVSVVPLGVDLEVFRPTRAHPAARDEIQLVCVGRLSREKWPDLAVETLRALHARGIAARLWMIGEGPRRRVLESRARDLPVVFTGHLHDRRELAGLLARADVALAPCPYETFGLAALEALACGTPVVAPDRGGVSELVQAGRRDAAGVMACGIATRSDPSSFADAVLDVLRAPADHRRHAARHRAEQYSWSRTANALMRIHRFPDAYLRDARRPSDTHQT